HRLALRLTVVEADVHRECGERIPVVHPVHVARHTRDLHLILGNRDVLGTEARNRSRNSGERSLKRHRALRLHGEQKKTSDTNDQRQQESPPITHYPPPDTSRSHASAARSAQASPRRNLAS